MNDDYKPDIITLLDDENNEHKFEILDTIEDDRGVFYALSPIFDNPADWVGDSGEYIILEAIEEDGEFSLAEPENETLLDELANEFEKHFDEMFEYEDQEENNEKSSEE